MFELILKALSLAALVASLAVIAIRVPSPSLIVVLAIVTAMAVYDFFIWPYRRRKSRRP